MSGAETTFSPTNAISFYPGKATIIAFRSTDINTVFSDIRHENKQSFIGEEIRSINQRDKQILRIIFSKISFLVKFV